MDVTQAGPVDDGVLDDDPLAQLASWAGDAAPPTTMVLATADSDGAPHARTVVVTAITAAGLRFHSSSPTTKTADLAVNPRASAVLHWPLLGRQAVVSGAVRELAAEVSDAAYPTRPRQLQLLGWVYEDLARQPVGPGGEQPPGAVEAAFAAAADRDPSTLPRPESWSTYELSPQRVELWRAGDDLTPPRRTRYLRGPQDGGWRSFPVLP